MIFREHQNNSIISDTHLFQMSIYRKSVASVSVVEVKLGAGHQDIEYILVITLLLGINDRNQEGQYNY